MRRRFGSFWLSFTDKMTTGIYNFVSLIVRIILLELASLLSAPIADKTQYFVHLSFSSTLPLISSISRVLQKLIKYFNGTTIDTFLKTPFAPLAQCFLILFPYI